MQHRGFWALLFLGVVSIAAFAVTPQFWENFSQEDLLQGSLNRVSLTSDGKLSSAPAYDLFFDTGQPYIFSAARDKAGNLYIGTGDEGKVFKVDPQGKGSLYFQTKELNVFAIALDSSDNLYVGTSPDGKVYKVTGPDHATEFCDPEEKYIWSMVFDTADNLYVGTGPTGAILKVDKSGKKSTFYTCGDNHAICLVRGNNNNLLAGTSPGGLVIEITPDGKGFTLLDSPMQEVHGITVDRFGTVYAIASSVKGIPPIQPKTGSTSAAPASTATVTVSVEPVVAVGEKAKETKSLTTTPGGDKETANAKSAVYAIAKDGSTETIYSSDEQMVFDGLVRSDGSLLIATGPKGRLLSIDVAKQVTVVTDSPEEQMTRLLPAGDVIYAAGSNQGKVYKLQNQRAATGTYESKTMDAKAVASWGKMSWRLQNSAGGTVALSTRSGNTEKPDNSWSEWSPAYTAPGQQISSPRARFLQWRASFKRSSAQGVLPENLERVQIAYLQQNLRPQVVSLEVLPCGIELQKQPSLALGGLSLTTPATTSDGRSLNAPRERGRERQPLAPRQVLQPGAQSFTWKATDDNEDSLEYSLYFKGEEESDWKLLQKKITDTFYTLNAASLPDGAYRLKVVASDAPSNPNEKSLIGELVSDPFVIANSSPQVEIANSKINGKKVEVQFRASVRTGNIATAEFSVDGGDWFLVFPLDGIADSVQEEYRISTPELSVGEHLIGIRASDRDGNTGTFRLVVQIQ
jgi:hypothetical protein